MGLVACMGGTIIREKCLPENGKAGKRAERRDADSETLIKSTEASRRRLH